MLNGFKKIIFASILPMLLVAQGTGVLGSYRVFHIAEARTFESGRLVLYSNMNFFTGTRPAFDPGSGVLPASNWWNNQGNLALSYGIADHFDASVIIKLYQDNNGAEENNLPSDVDLALKVGNFEIGSGQFRVGGMANVLFGVGSNYDVLLEPYNPGGFQFGVGGLFSYYNDPYLPGKAFSTHLNLGYWSFNEAGNKIHGSSRIAINNSSALRYGLGFNIPVDLFDITFEVWGSNFITKPDSFANGVEDYLYVTPGFKYYPLSWLTVNFGLDFLLTGKDEETIPPAFFAQEVSNYSSWKVQLGLDFKIMPLTRGATEAEVEKQEFNNKIEFFESVIEERRRTETIEDELDKLKTQRRQAEKELEELRQLLDEQEK